MLLFESRGVVNSTPVAGFPLCFLRRLCVPLFLGDRALKDMNGKPLDPGTALVAACNMPYRGHCTDTRIRPVVED